MELLLKYFPHLTEEQKRQFGALGELYADWNAKINVISRKDIGNSRASPWPSSSRKRTSTWWTASARKCAWQAKWPPPSG